MAEQAFMASIRKASNGSKKNCPRLPQACLSCNMAVFMNSMTIYFPLNVPKSHLRILLTDFILHKNQ